MIIEMQWVYYCIQHPLTRSPKVTVIIKYKRRRAESASISSVLQLQRFISNIFVSRSLSYIFVKRSSLTPNKTWKMDMALVYSLYTTECPPIECEGVERETAYFYNKMLPYICRTTFKQWGHIDVLSLQVRLTTDNYLDRRRSLPRYVSQRMTISFILSDEIEGVNGETCQIVQRARTDYMYCNHIDPESECVVSAHGYNPTVGYSHLWAVRKSIILAPGVL